MKRIVRSVFIGTLLVALAGCTSPRPLDAEEAIEGVWKSEGSVAVYEIAKVDGRMTVKGSSSYSGKELMVRDVSWDGTVLRFTSYMPSTDFKVVHENRLVDCDTMVSSTIGKGDHTVTWKKQR